MAKQTYTFAVFAQSLGAHTRITLDISKLWHTEYLSADEVTRKARREEFIRNFLVGYLTHGDKPMQPEAAEKRAEKIMGQSRDDRSAEDQKVYDAARAKFTYHVVRPEKKQASSGKTDPVAEALALVAAMTPAQKKRFLAAL